MTSEDARGDAAPRRHRWTWWHERSTTFRRIVRSTLAVLACGVLGLGVGVLTASFTGSLGPHQAEYSTTLDGEVAIDMGPLGAIVVDSPLPLGLGVDVEVKEIPVELTDSSVSPIAGLTADLSSYTQFLSEPQLSIEEAANGLVLDALGRTAVVWSLLLTTLALGRLVSHGVLRDAVRSAWRQPGVPAVSIALTLALVAVPLATASQGSGGVGRPSAVLAGTPLEDARITGRLGTIVDYYGQVVVDAINDNAAFYSEVEANLRAAYASEPQPLAPDGVPASVAVVDPTGLETIAPAAEPVEGAAVADAATAGAAPVEPDPVTIAMITDIHCNTGMGPVIGAAVELSEADLVLNAGDTVMGGTSVESVCVNALADGIGGGVPVVVANGNHDSDVTARQESGHGWTVLRGEPVEVEGIRILGDTDPTLTALGQPTHLVRDEPIPQMGQRLATTACEALESGDPVDILLVHNPIAGRAALDAGCVPLSLNGHMHRRVGPWQWGYGWQYLSASTAGATSGTSTIGTLQNAAAITIIRWDRGNRVPMDFRLITLGVDRSATIGPWESFPVLSDETVQLEYPPRGETPWD